MCFDLSAGTGQVRHSSSAPERPVAGHILRTETKQVSSACCFVCCAASSSLCPPCPLKTPSTVAKVHGPTLTCRKKMPARTADAVTLGDSWLGPAIKAGYLQPLQDVDSYRWWVSVQSYLALALTLAISLALALTLALACSTCSNCVGSHQRSQPCHKAAPIHSTGMLKRQYWKGQACPAQHQLLSIESLCCPHHDMTYAGAAAGSLTAALHLILKQLPLPLVKPDVTHLVVDSVVMGGSSQLTPIKT